MTARSVSVLALLLTACAAWETTTPSYTPPPAESPAPSHYAPPPPQDPEPQPEPIAEPEPTPTPTPEPTPIVTSPVTKLQAAIASVQLLEDCPEPAPEPAQALVTEAPGAPAMGQSSRMERPGGEYRRMCSQSTVQLSVQADGVQPFKIVAVRVLAANGKKVVGSTKLRAPTTWDDATGTYGEWQEYTAAGKDLKVSYKMGDLEFTPAAEKLSGVRFNTYSGPFLLEIEVSAGGRRKTVRSPEFTREPPHLMVT